MQALKMTLTKKWFDLILSGEKVFEYREFKKYWIERLICKNPATGYRGGSRHYDEIHFTNGYGSEKPFMRVEYIGHSIMEGEFISPDNGEPIEAGKQYFVIGLGKVVESRNIQGDTI